MQTTMNLLDRALLIQKAAAWARDLNVSEAAMSLARKRGRLSPTLAGSLAEKLHEDAIRWTAIAAVEAEPDSPLKTTLMKKFEKTAALYLRCLFRSPTTTLRTKH